MKHRLLTALAGVFVCALIAATANADPTNTYPTVTPAAGDKILGFASAAPHGTQSYTAQSIANLAAAPTSFPTVITFPAPTTTQGSIILTPGSPGPTAPPNGSIWVTTAGAFARVNGVTAALGVTVPSAAAGGSNTQLQYNASGVLAGVPGFTWNGSTLTFPSSLTLGAGTSLNAPNLVADTGLMTGTSTVIASPNCGGLSGATWLIGTDIGSYCSHVTTGGTDNLSDGTITLNSLTSGFGNMAFGSETLKDLTTGSNNACFGFESCHIMTTGGNNDAVGFDALAAEVAGSNNTAVGQGSLSGQNGGNSNAGFGAGAGSVITTGDINTCIGPSSCATITTGSNNIAVGTNNLTGITTGSNNVWIGGHGTTLSDQSGSITLADGNGVVLEQYQAANGFDQFNQSLEIPAFASSKGLSGSGFTLGSTTIVGTGGSVACAASHVCDSISGEVTLTTGTGVSANGLALTIAFALTRAAQPACIVSSFKAGAVDVASNFNDSSTTQLTVNSSANLSSSTAYTLRYICAGD